MEIIKEVDLNEEWKFLKLEDVAKSISAGGTPKRSINEYWEDGNIPWLKISDLKTIYISKAEENITKEGLNNSSAKLFSKGTILYSIFATLGAIGILDFEATTNQAIAGILPNNNVIDTKYLYYCLISEKRNIIAKKSRATQDNINLKILRNHGIPVPPLKTQKKIVEILERAEKLKEWRSEADELADELLKSVFLDMFGNPERNEKEWKLVKFKDMARIDKTSIKPDQINDEDKYIGLEHIESDTGTILDVLNAKETKLKSNKFSFDENCILYGKLRPYLNKVALPNFEGVCSTDILPIRPIQNISNKYFIAFLLKNDYYVRKSTEMSTGANLPRISPKTLENFDTYLPPIELQNQFADIVKQVETLKTHQKQSKQEINKLFNALMQKAFKGELTC